MSRVCCRCCGSMSCVGAAKPTLLSAGDWEVLQHQQTLLTGQQWYLQGLHMLTFSAKSHTVHEHSKPKARVLQMYYLRECSQNRRQPGDALNIPLSRMVERKRRDGETSALLEPADRIVAVEVPERCSSAPEGPVSSCTRCPAWQLSLPGPVNMSLLLGPPAKGQALGTRLVC